MNWCFDSFFFYYHLIWITCEACVSWWLNTVCNTFIEYIADRCDGKYYYCRILVLSISVVCVNEEILLMIKAVLYRTQQIRSNFTRSYLCHVLIPDIHVTTIVRNIMYWQAVSPQFPFIKCYICRKFWCRQSLLKFSFYSLKIEGFCLACLLWFSKSSGYTIRFSKMDILVQFVVISFAVHPTVFNLCLLFITYVSCAQWWWFKSSVV
jgi:hypothetical protein